MTRDRLLTFAALIELVTGLALIVRPGLVVSLLLGADISGVGLAICRIAGAGLMALAVACWPRQEAAHAAIRGMLTYNALAGAYLGYVWIGHDIRSVILPLVAVLHVVLASLFLRLLLHRT
jgi:hypothetical protein